MSKTVTGLGNCIGTLGAVPVCFCCPNAYKNVNQGNVGLVTRFGRFHKAVDPGLVRVNPLSERLIQVDVKVQIVGECSHPVTPSFGMVAELRGKQRSQSRFA